MRARFRGGCVAAAACGFSCLRLLPCQVVLPGMALQCCSVVALQQRRRALQQMGENFNGHFKWGRWNCVWGFRCCGPRWSRHQRPSKWLLHEQERWVAGDGILNEICIDFSVCIPDYAHIFTNIYSAKLAKSFFLNSWKVPRRFDCSPHASLWTPWILILFIWKINGLSKFNPKRWGLSSKAWLRGISHFNKHSIFT